MLKQAPYRAKLAATSPGKTRKVDLSERKDSDIISSKMGRKSRDTQIRKLTGQNNELISSMDYEDEKGLYQGSILAMSHSNLPD